MDAQPAPPAAPRGHYSVAKLPDHWFIACSSRDLRRRTLAVTIQGVPIVLFRRADGRPGALEDRCPHRNAPLSAGRVRHGELECGYHGWRFDDRGTCVAVPGLATPPEARATQAVAFPSREQDGYVWVYSSPGSEPRGAPFAFPHLTDR